MLAHLFRFLSRDIEIPTRGVERKRLDFWGKTILLSFYKNI